MLHHLSRRAFLAIGAAFITIPVIGQLSGCNGNGQPEPEKKVFSDPKFELLDLALQHEYGAVVQYGNHAGVIAALDKDPEGAIAVIIEEVISQEVKHAILLTEILKKNGVEPTIAVWPPQTADAADEMIQKDIAAEDGAIKLYQQILGLDFDDQTENVIEQILWSEKSHHQMFTDILPALS